MIAALALLALASTTQGSHGDRGLVVLLGERALVSAVVELELDERPRALLHTGNAGPDVDEPRPGECEAACFELRSDRYRDADDPRLIAWTRAATRVTFNAGSLREWFDALYPRGDEGELVAAVREAWLGGALVVGRGDRAALLSGWSVIGRAAELGIPECDPHDLERPRSMRGLALQDLATLDTDGRSAGSFERLLRVLADDHARPGVWLDDSAALVARSRQRTLLCRGSYVLLIDIGRARRVGDSVLGVRLSILRAGDVWLARGGRVELAPGRAIVERRENAAELAAHDVFATDELVATLDRLAESPPSTLAIRDARCELALELDQDSRVARDERALSSWIGLRGDFSWYR